MVVIDKTVDDHYRSNTHIFVIFTFFISFTSSIVHRRQRIFVQVSCIGVRHAPNRISKIYLLRIYSCHVIVPGRSRTSAMDPGSVGSDGRSVDPPIGAIVTVQPHVGEPNGWLRFNRIRYVRRRRRFVSKGPIGLQGP